MGIMPRLVTSETCNLGSGSLNSLALVLNSLTLILSATRWSILGGMTRIGPGWVWSTMFKTVRLRSTRVNLVVTLVGFRDTVLAPNGFRLSVGRCSLELLTKPSNSVCFLQGIDSPILEFSLDIWV